MSPLQSTELFLLNLGFAALGLFLPCWAVLMWVLPALYVAAANGALPPVFVLGAARLGSQDLVLIIVVLRTALTWRTLVAPAALSRVYAASIIYFVVLAAATCFSLLRFESGIFLAELNSLARFGAQAAVLPLFCHSVRKRQNLTRACSFLPWAGYVIALNVFVGAAVFSLFGVQIGEVIRTVNGTRVFGYLGDTVGYMLVLFILIELAEKRYFRAGALGIATMLTGTIGAVTTLLVSLLALPTVLPMGKNQRRVIWIGIPILFLAVGGALWSNLGMVQSRTYEFTASQRQASMAIGVDFFLKNPVTGVGFAGYTVLAETEGLRTEFLNRIGKYSESYAANASNQWIQVLCDAGICGMAGFIILLRALFRLLRKGAKENGPTASISIAGYCWIAGLAFGNQSAVWFLPGSLITHWLWVAIAVSALPAHEAVKTRWAMASSRFRHRRVLAPLAPARGVTGVAP